MGEQTQALLDDLRDISRKWSAKLDELRQDYSPSNPDAEYSRGMQMALACLVDTLNTRIQHLTDTTKAGNVTRT